MNIKYTYVRVPSTRQHAAHRSPIARRERVVRRAESRPVGGDRVGSRSTGNVFSHDSSEPGVEVEVDVAVDEPWAGIVRLEADRDIVSRAAPGGNGITPDGVIEVVLSRVGTADHCEGVLWRTVKDIVSNRRVIQRRTEGLTPCKWIGWGPAIAFAAAGKLISIDELIGSA